MTDVPTNNTPINIVDDALDDALKVVEQLGEKAAETAVPELNAIILKQAFEAACDYLEENFAIEIKGLGTILMFRLQAWGETNGVNAGLKAFAASYQKGPLHESDPVVQSLIASARAAGHWDGAASNG